MPGEHPLTALTPPLLPLLFLSLLPALVFSLFYCTPLLTYINVIAVRFLSRKAVFHWNFGAFGALDEKSCQTTQHFDWFDHFEV